MKCLITITSLLECTGPSDNTKIRIKRAIPFSVLQNNLIRVYRHYKKKYTEYTMECFNLAEKKIDLKKDPWEYELILENGFMIYILLSIFIDNLSQYEADEDVNEFIHMFEQNETNPASFFKNDLMGEFGKFGNSLFGIGTSLITSLNFIIFFFYRKN